jgi:hypothetical protein
VHVDARAHARDLRHSIGTTHATTARMKTFQLALVGVALLIAGTANASDPAEAQVRTFSPALRNGGIVLVVVGGAGFIATGIMAGVGNVFGQYGSQSGLATAACVMGVLSGAAIAAGIPMIVVGSEKVSVSVALGRVSLSGTF